MAFFIVKSSFLKRYGDIWLCFEVSKCSIICLDLLFLVVIKDLKSTYISLAIHWQFFVETWQYCGYFLLLFFVETFVISFAYKFCYNIVTLSVIEIVKVIGFIYCVRLFDWCNYLKCFVLILLFRFLLVLFDAQSVIVLLFHYY